MNNEPNPTRKYKRSDPNFKRSAVELWLSGGRSAPAVATELGSVTRQDAVNWFASCGYSFI